MQQMRKLSNFQGIAPFLLRLGVGLTFFFSGLGKVMGGVDGVTGFFGSLGIPMPGIMAPFISYLELIGGIALILGLLTRPFSILLACTMVVAILTAKLGAFGEAPSIAQGWNEIRTELMLLVTSLSLALTGAGKPSVDAALFGDTPDATTIEPTLTPTRTVSRTS